MKIQITIIKSPSFCIGGTMWASSSTLPSPYEGKVAKQSFDGWGDSLFAPLSRFATAPPQGWSPIIIYSVYTPQLLVQYIPVYLYSHLPRPYFQGSGRRSCEDVSFL